MLDHLNIKLFRKVAVAVIAVEPILVVMRYQGSVAAHGHLSTAVGNFVSLALTLLLLWAVAVRRSTAAGLIWVFLTLFAASEMIRDSLNGWSFQPTHVLGGVSLLLELICAALVVQALLEKLRTAGRLKVDPK